MKLFMRIALLIMLGMSLGACGDKDSPGPFGNTPGPKKPTQL